ncbi:response regulator transcription factor [Flavobacteriales bacterium]|nr:response regulator transcription factor [Flavobacteriales bacterium]
METIIVCRDEKECNEYVNTLNKNELNCSCISKAGDALNSAIKERPDLIFLDIALDGDMDGFELCEKLRNNKQLDGSIISFLTESKENYTKILAYRSGADDYIETPINPHLFAHKVAALSRRIEKETDTDFNINLQNETLSIYWKDRQIELPRKDYSILTLLLSDTKKVFSRKEIITQVWDSDAQISPRTVDVHIRKIREKIGKQNIESVKGIGYRIVL